MKGIRKINLKLIILFGSRTRGDYTDESDYDVLIVADDLPQDPRESYVLLYDKEFPKVSSLGMRTEIFIKKLHEGSTFILEIIEDGKVLYADSEFLNNVIMKLYKKMRRCYVRRGMSWIRICKSSLA